MHEYEFRFVVQHTSASDLDSLLDKVLVKWQSSSTRPVEAERRPMRVLYAKPHFRYRDGCWETKRKVSASAVYHDSVWFQWVHSIETPFARWSRSTHRTFLDVVGNYQDPFVHESRVYVRLDDHASLYAFRDRLVFEWEYGSFADPLSHISAQDLLKDLCTYRDVYGSMKHYPPPPYPLNERGLCRKSATCVEMLPEGGGDRTVVANKLDGIFGFVFSYPGVVKEKWEGYERIVRSGVTLGDGVVYAAEKLPDRVVLLDVYRVRGLPVAKWSRRAVLEEYLPNLKLPENVQVQRYSHTLARLPHETHLPTDGWIAHDVVSDRVYKMKERHSLDLVYYDAALWCGNDKKIACSEKLQEGSVYEVSMTGQIIRQRNDRFTGNTEEQVEKILRCAPWKGPPMEKNVVLKESRRKRQKFFKKCRF